MILYVLGFSSRGFTWVHGALFASMISSTDALAATAILKQGGAVLGEGWRGWDWVPRPMPWPPQPS